MLDYLRSLSWVPRRLHGSARELERVRNTFEGATGRSGTVAELAEAMGLTLEQYHLLVSEINTIDLGNSDELWNDDHPNRARAPLADQTSDPWLEIERKEMIKLMWRASGALNERQKLLLKLYYDEDLTMKEVGAALQITESRASQLHSKALGAMRRAVMQLVGTQTEVC
jgi:RNA polymerase sigma factor for flagellar operon FliA